MNSSSVPPPFTENGLQSREIYELPLKGALIVLSGCRTADGRFSAAEGLHSLSARSCRRAAARSWAHSVTCPTIRRPA